MIYRIINSLPIMHDKRILELGCGKGRITMNLRMDKENETYDIGKKIIPKEVVGVEIYDDYIDFCRKHKIFDRIIKHDISKPLPFEDQSFDIVICTEAIEHLEKEDGWNLLREIDRICRGTSLISSPCGHTEGRGDELEDEHNEYQKHKSAWRPNDYRKFGYTVKGYGFFINGSFMNWLTMPIVKYFPSLAYQLLAVKDHVLKVSKV